MSTYRVDKIKSIGNYYVIYVSKNDSTFKIASKKEKVNGCNKIKKNRSYQLRLSEIQAMGGPEIDCFTFDEKTVICKDADVDLFIANNLKGLCITEL